MRGRLLIIAVVILVLLSSVSLAAAQGQTYIVGAGDVLDLIASYFYIDQDCIIAATPGLGNGSSLYPGQRLNISYCAPYDGQAGGNGRIRGHLLGSGPGGPVFPPPGDQGGGGRYIVQYGDQLGLIAQRFGVTPACLMQVNNIFNPNLIYAGQALEIAACGGNLGGNVGGDQGGGAPNPSIPSTYVIQPGDKLVDIATRFNVTVACLVRVNALPNQNLIRRGDTLAVAPCIQQGGGAAPLPTSQMYTVQAGDRLTNIAYTFGVDATCLAQANPTISPDFLQPGQMITIDFANCAR